MMKLPLSTLLLSTASTPRFRTPLSQSYTVPSSRTGRGKKSSIMSMDLSSSAPGIESPVHRILCYGDSLTAGTSISPWELFPYAPHLERALNAGGTDRPQFVVRHRGMPGWTAEAMVELADDPQCGLRSAIRNIQNPSLDCAILLAGTNDLGYAVAVPEGRRVSHIVGPVRALHEMAWQEGVPRTLAVAIPPSGYQAQVASASELAEAVNRELDAFCRASQGRAKFVTFPFPYERDSDNWSPDGLHFSPEGYRVLGEYLANPVLELLNGI